MYTAEQDLQHLCVRHNKTFDQDSATVCDSTIVTLSDLKNYCSRNYSELENVINTAESKDKITSLLKKKSASLSYHLWQYYRHI